MAGLTHIQVTATLYFDDGNVVNFATPMINKDIRYGDYFSSEEAAAVLEYSSSQFAKIVDTQTIEKLHNMAKIISHEKSIKRKPRFDDDFSSN